MLKDLSVRREWRDVETLLNVIPIHNFIASPRNHNDAFRLFIANDCRLKWIYRERFECLNLLIIAFSQITANYLLNFLNRSWLPFHVGCDPHECQTGYSIQRRMRRVVSSVAP